MPSFNITSCVLEVLKRDDVIGFQRKQLIGSWAHGFSASDNAAWQSKFYPFMNFPLHPLHLFIAFYCIRVALINSAK